MDDLFEREQKILDSALAHLTEVRQAGRCSPDVYANMVNEYRRLLKQLRRITRISDKTAVNLNTSKLNLQDKVHYDELTGLYNRRFLDENLKQTVESLLRTGGILSVLMVDVDYFKRYNDTYGHGARDRCLQCVASCLKACVREQEDFVARYGGEEFVAVLPGVDEDGARAVARRMLQQMGSQRIPHEKSGTAPYVTVSVGIATGRVMEPYTPEYYLKIADQALYASKQRGRNQYTFNGMEMEDVQ